MQHRGRGFEPRHEYSQAGLAQSAEHSANNAAVTGSSPVSCNAYLIDYSTLTIFARGKYRYRLNVGYKISDSCRARKLSIRIYLCLAVAQLVEHGIVVVNNIPVVPGSNPGGEIFCTPTAKI